MGTCTSNPSTFIDDNKKSLQITITENQQTIEKPQTVIKPIIIKQQQTIIQPTIEKPQTVIQSTLPIIHLKNLLMKCH